MDIEKRTNTAVAERLGVDQSYVSLLRRGLRMPSREVLARMIGALGMDRGDTLAAYIEGPAVFSAYLREHLFTEEEEEGTEHDGPG